MKLNCHVLFLSICLVFAVCTGLFLVLVPVNSTSKTTTPEPRVNQLRFLSVSRIPGFSFLVELQRPPPSALASSLLQFKGLNSLNCETIVALASSLLQFKGLNSLNCETLVARTLLPWDTLRCC